MRVFFLKSLCIKELRAQLKFSRGKYGQLQNQV